MIKLELKYINLPFSRIAPYKKGLNPFSETDYPNEPNGWVNIPVVIASGMSKDDIMLEAIEARDALIDNWLKSGNCTMGDEDEA